MNIKHQGPFASHILYGIVWLLISGPLHSTLRAADVDLQPQHTGKNFSTPEQLKPMLSWLLAGRVFQTKALNLRVEGALEELPVGSENRDIFWTCAIAGGVRPKFHRYFMFRRTTDPGRSAFEIVFFDDKADGFFVPVLSTAFPRSGASEIYYSYQSMGGGGGASLKVRRTYLLTLNSSAAGEPIFGAAISEEIVRSKAWHFFSQQKSAWRAEMQFQSIEVPESVLMAARKISMDVEAYNKSEEAELKGIRAH